MFDALAARDLLEGAIADPKHSLAHSALAEAWSKFGYDKKEQAEARQAFELAANLSREEKLVVEGRYRVINHEYDKAIEIYRSLFVLFPDNLDYGLKLAAVQVRSGKAHDIRPTAESQKIVDHPGIDVLSYEYPLAVLRIGRSRAALGQAGPSRDAYEKLFVL